MKIWITFCLLYFWNFCFSSTFDLSKENAVVYSNLTQFWQGQAYWQFLYRYNETTIPDYESWNSGEGSSFTITQNGIWYLFARIIFSHDDERIWKNASANCPALLGVTVRKSLDKGKSWSRAVNFIVPSENSLWECMGTDGGAFYDEQEQTWHYLFQCLDRNFVWNGCHLQYKGTDPTQSSPSSWTGTGNPVIRSGSLWSRICANPAAICHLLPQKLPQYLTIPNQEGTFDIFQKQNGYFYVSFHGYDNINGYRGIAKTNNWINWIAAQDDLPSDAIFEPLIGNSLFF